MQPKAAVLWFERFVCSLSLASGDLRNVLKTVSALPEKFTGLVTVDINDIDIDIVIRNAIFLLVLNTVPDATKAAECVIHLWYSALVTPECITHLKEAQRLVQEVCTELTTQGPETSLAKTWTFPLTKSSLQLTLKKKAWTALLQRLSPPIDLTALAAQQLRASVMKAAHRDDNYDRKLCAMTRPGWRVCSQQFRDDGLLLPFGHSRAGFTVPNPTLFCKKGVWPLRDTTDPLEGWSVKDVSATQSRPKHDVTGKLYHHVHQQLASVRQRLECHAVDFRLYNGDVCDIAPALQPVYDRIEVSEDFASSCPSASKDSCRIQYSR